MIENKHIIEEHENNVGTGVEQEDESDESVEPGQDMLQPYDPRKIRVDSKPFSIKQIIEMIDCKDLDIAPDFQRRRVWKEKQKSLLIESILLRIPLPVFYFSADDEGRMQVVDGVQRLSTIKSFSKNEFSLENLEYLQNDLNKKKFNDIENTIWSRRFLSTTLNANVIDPQTPDGVKFDIFRRLNTGGTPLTAQEIRHCISKPRTRDFLRRLCNQEAFHQATRNQLKNHIRMVDQDVVLRFIAFKLLPKIEEYSKNDNLDNLLTSTIRKLDDKKTTPDDQLDALEAGFVQAMKNALFLFGEHAFRKWYLDDDEIHPINRALFDVWSVELSDKSQEWLEPRKKKIVTGIRELMTSDNRFIKAISAGTSKFHTVAARFSKIRELLKE